MLLSFGIPHERERERERETETGRGRGLTGLVHDFLGLGFVFLFSDRCKGFGEFRDELRNWPGKPCEDEEAHSAVLSAPLIQVGA